MDFQLTEEQEAMRCLMKYHIFLVCLLLLPILDLCASGPRAQPVTIEEVLRRGRETNFANEIRERGIAISTDKLNNIDLSKLPEAVAVQLQTEMFYFPWGTDVVEVKTRLGKPTGSYWIQYGTDNFIDVPSPIPEKGMIQLEYKNYGLTYVFHDRKLAEVRYSRVKTTLSKMLRKSIPGAKISSKYLSQFLCEISVTDILFDKEEVERTFNIDFSKNDIQTVKACGMTVHAFYERTFRIYITNPRYEKYIWMLC